MLYLLSVSYTHLDVYKRQAVNNIDNAVNIYFYPQAVTIKYSQIAECHIAYMTAAHKNYVCTNNIKDGSEKQMCDVK